MSRLSSLYKSISHILLRSPPYTFSSLKASVVASDVINFDFFMSPY